MMTTKLYQTDTYLKEWDACILAAKPAADGGCLIQLDQTAFLPGRGAAGVPVARGDPGELTGCAGRCIFRRGRAGRRRSDLAHGKACFFRKKSDQ